MLKIYMGFILINLIYRQEKFDLKKVQNRREKFDPKKGRRKCTTFKVDFEKAFDSINWNYLPRLMRRMGFGLKWCNWIKNCQRSALVSLLINGSPILRACSVAA